MACWVWVSAHRLLRGWTSVPTNAEASDCFVGWTSARPCPHDMFDVECQMMYSFFLFFLRSPVYVSTLFSSLVQLLHSSDAYKLNWQKASRRWMALCSVYSTCLSRRVYVCGMCCRAIVGLTCNASAHCRSLPTRGTHCNLCRFNLDIWSAKFYRTLFTCSVCSALISVCVADFNHLIGCDVQSIRCGNLMERSDCASVFAVRNPRKTNSHSAAFIAFRRYGCVFHQPLPSIALLLHRG